MTYSLATPLSDISIPDKFLTKLHKLELHTVEDLLFHTPRKYTDYSNIVSVQELYVQESGSLVTIMGTVVSKQSKQIKGKKLRLIEVTFEDETGRVKAVWFNQAFILKQAQEGMRMAVAGTVQFSGNRVNLRDATLEPVKSGKPLLHTGRLVAEYPTTQGIRSRFFRYQIASILSSSDLSIQDYLPQSVGQEFPSLLQAFRQIHFPQTHEEAHNARYRFAFEEAFFLQVSLLQQRMHLQSFFAPVLAFHKREIQQFVHNLAFDLTNDQRKTAWEIIQDTEQSIPMNRLLEGDVGSGKTIVATIALLNTTLNGVQAALMAPTEVLALQHFERLVTVFHQTSFIDVPKVALITGSEAKLSTDPQLGGFTDVSRSHVVREVEKGNIHLVIGTHALISDYLTFADLGLVLIDEQHRFGVNQRAKLQEKGMELSKQMHRMPHLLSMTATPIPRTLALTVYGDLSVSRITERPPNRKLPITRVVSQNQLQ
ncbi:MAG: DEAD/DEAH box helicase, partial [Candidatus Paceibacteria bacterium]